MENKDNDLQKKIDYVIERATAEKTVQQYLKHEYGNKLDLNKFVSDILESDKAFLEKMENVYAYSNDDEYNYIIEETSYSYEMIELILWFLECYQMKNNCIEYDAQCKACGCKTLYMREIEDILFGNYMECGNCGKEYSDDDLYVENDVYLSPDEDLPLCETKEEVSKTGIITKESYIFKAAIGYRKGIWRKIQISAGATLADLAYAILDAFCFDYDHLFAFYMDEKGRTRNVPVYYSKNYSGTPKADQTLLKDFDFAEGTKFLFLYDFGDEWNFTITFEKEIIEKTLCSVVIQERGEAPEQY